MNFGARHRDNIASLPGEVWASIPDFGGHYAASSLGRVMVLDRTVKKYSAVAGKVVEQHYKARILNPTDRSKRGYPVVHLGLEGKRLNVSVHTLVLIAFIGPKPKGMEACHGDGDSRNNRLDNLRWDTHLANNLDRKRHGRYAVGEKHHGAKLSKADVLAIRSGNVSLADSGLSKTHYYRIRKGLGWSHVYGNFAEAQRYSR